MTRDQVPDEPSRRTVLRQGAALALTLGAAGAVVSRSAASAAPPPVAPAAAPEDFTTMFGLRYPIVAAALSGPGGPELAIAVADAGGFGSLALTPETPESTERVVRQVRESTTGAFFVNYVLRSEPRSLAQALAAGAPAVQFSWGMPTAAQISQIGGAKAKFGVQVTGAGSASRAIDLGADYLVCQGMEAGGHVQGLRPLDQTFEEVLGAVRGRGSAIPVLASGGIATGGDIRRVIFRGASGAVLGTRFVATRESRAHPDYKRALVDAGGASDTVCTTCLNTGWPNAPHRLLLSNKTFQMWESASCPPEGHRPGETDVVGYAIDGSPIERYRINTPVEGMSGDVLEMGTFAGTGVGSIRDVPAAGELTQRLWGEYAAAG